MAEDGYNSSAWETTDGSDTNPSSNHQNQGRAQPLPLVVETSQTLPIPPIPPKSVSPPPRISSDSASQWHDNAPVTLELRDTVVSTIPSEGESLVEVSFDENMLRALCELDVSFIPQDPKNLITHFLTVWSAAITRSNKTEFAVV